MCHLMNYISIFSPLNKIEIDQRSYAVVDTPSKFRVSVQEKPNANPRAFNYDRVFGAKSNQAEVYKAVVGPLIGQVMQGE